MQGYIRLIKLQKVELKVIMDKKVVKGNKVPRCCNERCEKLCIGCCDA